MSRMLLLFSHALTEEQKRDANNSLGVSEFVALPDDLQYLWMNIPPAIPQLADYLKPVRRWIKETGNHGDYVLIQGDPGASYLMVNFAFSAGLIPLYSTTERKVEEEQMQDNTVKSKRVFKHKMFRRYEKGGGYDE